MENMAKYLLIAAGMFLAVMLISLLVYFYNQVSTFYSQEHESVMIEQAQEFNDRFEGYHRNDIRGSDLISLMNRVIDYNATESYFDGTEYKRIEVTIDLKGKNEQFKDVSGTTLKYLNDEKITNTNNSGDKWKDDRELVAITNTPSDLIQKAKNNGINNMTDTKLQQLSSKIYTIFANENDTEESKKMNIYTRSLRADIIEDILGIELTLDEDAKAAPGSQSKKYIDAIKEITNQYSQYTNFKRAYFDCTEIKYDPNTNRVFEMNFEIQVDDDGNIVLN